MAPPDIVIMLFASIPSTLGLQGALQAAGFKGPIENTQTYDPQLAAPVEGRQRLRAVRCVRDGGHRAWCEADGRPTSRRPDAPLGVLSAVGYLSADMFIAALKKTGKNLTIAIVPEGGEQAAVQRGEDGRSDVASRRTGCSPACAGRS